MNKDNLVKLAKYILSEVSDEQFNMKHFRSDEGDSLKKFYSPNDCGTVGCALGWAPFVKGLEVVDSDIYKNGALDFEIYSKRVFGTERVSNWQFLFGGYWSNTDNRVIYFLEGGEDFEITEQHPYRKIDENKIYDY